MRYFLLASIFVLFSCSQVQKKKNSEEMEISEVVKKKIDEAKELLKLTKPNQAIAKLVELQDESLSPLEKSMKYNLKGVTLFNMGELEKSILNFAVAEKYAPEQSHIHEQIQLNMASGHFKLNKLNEFKDYFFRINVDDLTDQEKKKYAQLKLAYGHKIQDNYLILSSSLLLFQNAKSFTEVQGNASYEQLKPIFLGLTPGEKVRVMEEFEKSKNLAVASLAQIEIEQRYTSGDKSGAKDLLSWLDSTFKGNPEIEKFTSDFKLRFESSSKIEINHIGLVLPLSGDKSSFGQKALTGLEGGLKALGFSEKVKIFSKDSQNSPARGAQSVLELVREKKVAFIIGGLFPESAKAEYLEAKKYGVLYISLSPINLPKEEKNLHLIEVQGSIESQVEALLSDEIIKRFSHRLAVIYPDNESGKSYMEEIWRKANVKNLLITSVASFPKNNHDYRDTAQIFLGLKYPRERLEELRILENVYSLEKSNIRRVQTLPPVIDFDWVFLATFPHEASQLIPTLGYYDALKIKVIGGPSWISKSMVKEQKNLGTLYFIGDDPRDINQDLLNRFQSKHGKTAGLIEIMALDAIKIGFEIFNTSQEISHREDFDLKIRSLGSISGLSTVWDFRDGIWLKRMHPMIITGGEVKKLISSD